MREEYLSSALANSGTRQKLEIDSVTPIGTGQMAESYRIKFASSPNMPIKSVVVKVPSQNERSREASRKTRCYELETSFYSTLRSQVFVETPQCFHVWYDAPTDDFVLILEDITDATQGDQIRGATLEQAEVAVSQLVKLHSPLWGSSKLENMAWLPKHSQATSTGTGQLLKSVFSGFADRFGDKVNEEIISLGARLTQKYDRYCAAISTQLTVAHRDFRLDNLLFSSTPQGVTVKVVDWQTVGAMPGASDLAYFIGASFDVADRRKNEEGLVEQYCEGLREQKIDIKSTDIWTQYRLLGTSGYVMAIVASVLVKQTTRGDEMFAAMANRHGQQMLDLETEGLFS